MQRVWMPGDAISLQDMIDYYDPGQKQRRLQREREAQKEREPEKTRILIGVDLGKIHDPTAIAVVEMNSNNHIYYIRHLEWVRLGTSYPDVARILRDDNTKIRQHLSGRVEEVVYLLGATGVGEGPADIILEMMPRETIYKVYLTGGINWTIDYRHVRLPKT